ncbi:MAG: hypothetical protein ACPGJV_11140 [Bacteriovoracaceae bacterium]
MNNSHINFFSAQTFTDHPISWLILLGLILILIAMTLIIKKEGQKIDYEHEVFEIGNFQIKVPLWWTQKEGPNKQSLSFYRSDTAYEWLATYYWYPKKDIENSSEEFFRNFILNEKLELDESEAIIDELHSKSKEHYKVFRIEGTATQAKIKRCYVDCFIIEDEKNNEVLIGYSWSSILNGLVEGPYFERVLETLLD